MRVLAARFEAARQHYNDLLNEALKRQRLYRESRAYQAAGKLAPEIRRLEALQQPASFQRRPCLFPLPSRLAS